MPCLPVWWAVPCVTDTQYYPIEGSKIMYHVCWVDDTTCADCGDGMKCPVCGFDSAPTQLRRAGMCRQCQSDRAVTA